MPLGSSQDAETNRRRLTPAVAPEEQPVFATDGARPECSLCGVVVDFQVAVLGESPELIPVIERIADCFAILALGQCEFPLLTQKRPQPIENRHAAVTPHCQPLLRAFEPDLVFDVVQLRNQAQYVVRLARLIQPSVEELSARMSPAAHRDDPAARI